MTRCKTEEPNIITNTNAFNNMISEVEGLQYLRALMKNRNLAMK
jgi:hypothetical protein